MPRFWTACGKNHGPGYIAGAAKEFAVDKIPQPPQAESNGHGYNYCVGALPERDLTPSGENDAREYGANKPAMEGHATVPDCNYLQRMFQVVGVVCELVEKDVAQTCPDNEADGQGKDQVLEFSSYQAKVAGFLLSAYEEVTRDKPQNVHEPIPAEFYRADFDDIGVYVRKR